MIDRPTHRLAARADEVTRARTHLRMLREELEARGESLAQSRLRMLMAETPLAGGEVQVAADRYLVVRRRVVEAERRLLALESEPRRAVGIDPGQARPGVRP